MTTRRGFGLRAKWSVALLLASLVPVVLVAAWMMRIQRAGLAESEKDLEIATVDEASGAITSRMGSLAESTRRVGEALTDGRIVDDDLRLALAREALASSTAVDEVSIYDADGAYLDTIVKGEADARHVLIAPHTALDADERRRASSAGGVWRLAPGPREPWAAAWIAPMAREGTTRGFAAGWLPSGALSRDVTELARSRFGHGDALFLVDSSLTVVAGEATGPFAIGTAQRGSGIFSVIPLDAGSMQTPFGLTTEFVGAGGTPMVGTVRTLPQYRWAVVVQRPTAQAFVALAEVRRALVWAACAVSAIALLVGAWVARRTTRPIARLTELVRAYGERRFDQRADVHTGDELEELGGSLEQMATQLTESEAEIARRARVEAGLARYMPREVAEAVAEGETALALGGERRRVAVLFADVADFTPFAERAAPEDVVAFLNELFELLSEIVFRHEGMVDKYVGDCVMALFGVGSSEEQAASRAVAAAEDMQRFVEAQAGAWSRRFGLDVALGIGVAFGDALVGNLGGERRIEFTAIGDTVNIASRLEALARARQVLVTGDVAKAVPRGFSFVSLGEHPVRGREALVEILELET